MRSMPKPERIEAVVNGFNIPFSLQLTNIKLANYFQYFILLLYFL